MACSASVSALQATGCFAGEPCRANGLAAHVLHRRVAHISGDSGGFTVGRQTYGGDAKQFLAYFCTLPARPEQWADNSPSASNSACRFLVKKWSTCLLDR